MSERANRRADIAASDLTELLTAAPPDSVEVDGKRYAVYTDFRYGILLSELFSDDSVDVYQKIGLALRLISPELREAVERGEVPIQTAFDRVMAYYTCGMETERQGKGRSGEPAFDFSCDGERILTAFRQVYQLDLTVEHLHWWKFMALLRGLPPECELMRVIRLRLTDTGKISDDETRRRVRRAKAAVRIRKKTGKETKNG